MNLMGITEQARQAVQILLETREPKSGEILLVGCSTSEVCGKRIGSAGSEEVAAALMDGILPMVMENGLYLAVQGCEHLNRAVCVSSEIRDRLDLQEVWVKPWLHAGGAFITEATRRIPNAVMVEDIHAKATMGMDIGGTLIGMHLRPVVVPVHTDLRHIGEANLILARSRAKYTGGPRAQYDPIR